MMPGAFANRGDEALMPRELDLQIASTADDQFECPICLSTLRDPLQTRCGHRYCRFCVECVISASLAPPSPAPPSPGVFLCPVDKRPLSIRNDVWADTGIQREIKTLSFSCPNHTLGCHWTGLLSDLFSSHFRVNCGFDLVPCPLGCIDTLKIPVPVLIVNNGGTPLPAGAALPTPDIIPPITNATPPTAGATPPTSGTSLQTTSTTGATATTHTTRTIGTATSTISAPPPTTGDNNWNHASRAESNDYTSSGITNPNENDGARVASAGGATSLDLGTTHFVDDDNDSGGMVDAVDATAVDNRDGNDNPLTQTQAVTRVSTFPTTLTSSNDVVDATNSGAVSAFSPANGATYASNAADASAAAANVINDAEAAIHNHAATVPCVRGSCPARNLATPLHLFRSALRLHVQIVCPHRHIRCRECGQGGIESRFLGLHRLQECPNARRVCFYCGKAMTKAESDRHFDVNNKDPATRCPVEFKKCPYGPVGCDHVEGGSFLTQHHMKMNIVRHSELALAVKEKLEQRVDELQMELESTRGEMWKMTKGLVAQNHTIRQLQKDVNGLMAEVGEFRQSGREKESDKEIKNDQRFT